jgi:hypothetical protein
MAKLFSSNNSMRRATVFSPSPRSQRSSSSLTLVGRSAFSERRGRASRSSPDFGDPARGRIASVVSMGVGPSCSGRCDRMPPLSRSVVAVVPVFSPGSRLGAGQDGARRSRPATRAWTSPTSTRGLFEWIVRGGATDGLPAIVEGFARAQAAETPAETAALVREYRLPREAVRPEHLDCCAPTRLVAASAAGTRGTRSPRWSTRSTPRSTPRSGTSSRPALGCCSRSTSPAR